MDAVGWAYHTNSASADCKSAVNTGSANKIGVASDTVDITAKDACSVKVVDCSVQDGTAVIVVGEGRVAAICCADIGLRAAVTLSNVADHNAGGAIQIIAIRAGDTIVGAGA